MRHSATKKRRPTRWIVRGVLLVVLVYACVAVLPYAFPPSEEPDADWMAQASSEENVDSGTILPTGEDALDARLRLIAGAQDTIRVGTYIYAKDESGQIISAALLAAAERGVQVRIIVDGLIGAINLGNSPMAQALGSHPNVAMMFYNPVNLLDPLGLNARYHEKFFVVDDEWLILGGRNVSDEFLTPSDHPRYNYDMDVLIHHDRDGFGAAQQVAAYFDAMWASDVCALQFDSASGAQVEQAAAQLKAQWADIEASRVLTLPSLDAFVPIEKTLFISGDITPRVKASAVFNRLCDLMTSAKSRVILQTPYLVMDAAMQRKLSAVCDASSDMVILTNSAAVGNNIIASADGVIHGGMTTRLDAKVLAFEGDASMHTKAILIDDDISVFGSFNMDARSAYLDTELMLAVYSPDLNTLLADAMGDMLAVSAPINAAAEAAYPDVPRHTASLGKTVMLYVLSPFVSLFRFLA